MPRPRLTRTDVVLTLLSAAAEATLLGWYAHRHWFTVRSGRRA